MPDTATSVRVQGGNTLWAHSPSTNRESGPGGLPGSEDLATAHAAKYKNADLQSLNIIGQKLALNLLVGLREYEAPDTEYTTEIAIGTDATFDVVPASGTNRPVRLRLAMHDGYEWSNNHGEVAVTVTWTE